MLPPPVTYCLALWGVTSLSVHLHWVSPWKPFFPPLCFKLLKCKHTNHPASGVNTGFGWGGLWHCLCFRVTENYKCFGPQSVFILVFDLSEVVLNGFGADLLHVGP